MRRALGVLVAVAALGGAAAATRAVERRRLEGARDEARRAAATARQRAEDGLRVQVKAHEIQASAAAALPQLKALLDKTRGAGVDAALAGTFRDVVRNESYWAPFRKEFPVYALSLEGDDLQLVEGVEAGALAAGPLLREARERGLASATVLARGWPYAAAAAAMNVPSLQGITPVLVLARPFADATLRETAERAGGAVLLTDGRKVLAASGPRPELDLLQAAVGREGDGVRLADDGAWGASPVAVAPGVWLWVHASALSAARQAAATAATTKAAAWGIGALVAAVALALGLRRGRAPAPAMAEPAPAPVDTRGPTPPRTAPGLGDTLLAPGASPPPRANGQPFGRYLLVERLGEGGMSQVYTAVTFGAEGFRRKFVVKRLRPELARDPAVVSQFTDEANLASSLVHSNIVPVFDFGKVGDEYFLATEYILGRDLGRVVRRVMESGAGPLPAGLVLHCAHETLKALDYAHTKLGENGRPLGLVHRDVSPANVLVSARGEVKLFDFGIVKAEGRVTRTQAGVVKGNVSFMSPEQARGGDIDARADLFSLGLVMYYCLTGDVLYTGNTTYELLVKAATGPGPEEKARIAALPGPTAALVARALETDPAARFRSAGEFAAAVAPHASPGRELAELMQRLFAADFQEEERRFAGAVPPAGAAPLPGSGQHAGVRRS